METAKSGGAMCSAHASAHRCSYFFIIVHVDIWQGHINRFASLPAISLHAFPVS